MNEIQDASNALRRLGRGVELMLKDALDAYVQKDVALAEDIISRDNDVDQMYNGLFRQFITFMMEIREISLAVCIFTSWRKISNAWAIM